MATGKLIKQKPSEQTEVWEYENYFRKKWLYKDTQWLENHIKMLADIGPTGYVIDHGFDDNTMWIDTKKIKGQLADTFAQTDEFVSRITKFCLDHYKETKPYAHFDWKLNNMIVDNDEITLVDWDNCAVIQEGQVIDKMESDLKKSFGVKFDTKKFRDSVSAKNKEASKKSPTEKIKFVLELYSDYWANPPLVEIYIDEESKHKSFIKGTKEKPDVITFEHELTEGQTWKLMIDRYNKGEKDTVINAKGDILHDQLLHIKSIEIDDIDIGALVYEGVYKPSYPTRWALQQKAAGNILPTTLKNVTIMGHNGTWTLTATSPFYMWLLENLY